MTTTTADLFDQLALNQAVLDTEGHMRGTNEERFYLHLINGRTMQIEVDGNEMLATVWEKSDEVDENDYLYQSDYPLNKAGSIVRQWGNGKFNVRFTEDAENTPSGQTHQWAEVTNEAGDEIGWIVWLTDKPEEFEPELYKKAAREHGWELSDITPQGATARLAL